ncbi:hypothetical protein GCM10010358_78710 [Streptomyces minutiscleroticus]|uniref:Uncharacterized protein n=1 Tax=Streptomyces minutiscleroticus TaxID=68238 RepID=A0A918P2N2_9ACTN|nr:hypothetical protein GCM10010358_78710 [Streptomyces minutiscleroticus]
MTGIAQTSFRQGLAAVRYGACRDGRVVRAVRRSSTAAARIEGARSNATARGGTHRLVNLSITIGRVRPLVREGAPVVVRVRCPLLANSRPVVV